MASTNDVYRKIKEMSMRTPNPRPQILIQGIASELSLGKDQIVTSLAELKQLRLIQYEGASAAYVKLTLLGHTVKR